MDYQEALTAAADPRHAIAEALVILDRIARALEYIEAAVRN